MGFNPLIDKLPTEYGDFPINTSFRQPLRFFRLLEDDDLDQTEKDITTLTMFFPTWNYVRDMDKITRLASYIPYYISRGIDFDDDSGEVVFDWELDSSRVYSAFMQVYKIDLNEVDLHWWKFMTLFDSLPEDTKLQSVINIRGMTPPKRTKDNAEYVDSINRLKRHYAIKEMGIASLWDSL